MPLASNKNFISVGASGTDWRDTSKKILEHIQSVLTDNHKFTLGLIYVTDVLAQDLDSILNLFKSVTNIEHWSGSIGIGVFDAKNTYMDEPAISVMLMDLPEEQFCPFRFAALTEKQEKPEFETWLTKHTPMFVLTHSGSMGGGLSMRLKELENVTQGFLVGGVASSQPVNAEGLEEQAESDLSGIAFSQQISIVTSLSQGCSPIGDPHIITFSENEYVIRDLDNKRCHDVFQEDLRLMAIKRLGKDPDDIKILDDVDEDDIWKEIPAEFRNLFQGEVHVAFPVKGSDQNDYMVRNILGIDHELGLMAVGQQVFNGDQILFVHRNRETMKQDLSRMLEGLVGRVERDYGSFSPKGALYISCMARADYDFGQDADDELTMVRNVLGDIPMVGFYAGGEIMGARIYGYTGILTLFL